MGGRHRVAVVLVALGCGTPTSSRHQDDAALDAEQDASIDALIDAPIDAPFAATDATSGSRLKLGWLQTPDGLRSVYQTSKSYYDALLGADCGGDTWTDGKVRCTPAARSVVYGDSTCSTPLGYALGATETPYLEERDSPLTGRLKHVFTRGPSVPGPEFWERISPTLCSGPVPNSLSSTPAHPTLSSLVEVTNLVELNVAYTGPGPLQQAWRTSADGLRDPIPSSAFDLSLNSPCAINVVTGRCSPFPVNTTLFADSACTQAAYQQPPGPPPRFLTRSPACVTDDALYAVGPAITASALYKRTQGTCSINPSSGPVERYAVGPQVGVMKQTPLIATPAPGHRLQPLMRMGAGLSTPSRRFHDPVLDLDCYLTRLGCLPETASQTFFFHTEPGCTGTAKPFVVVRLPDQCGVPEAVPRFAKTSLGIHRVGAAHPIDGLWRRSGPDCDPASYETPLGFTYYDADPTPIPASAFETATYSVDP